MVHRVTTSSTTSDNEWQRVVQRVTTSSKRVTTNDNGWQQMTKSDNEWQGMTTSGTTSDNEWQWVTISANFSFFPNKRGAYYEAPEGELFKPWRGPLILQLN